MIYELYEIENENLWIDISWGVMTISTDKVGHWKTYPAEVFKYYDLVDRLKPETARKLCKDNILSLVKKY